jgi:hypothetical protein
MEQDSGQVITIYTSTVRLVLSLFVTLKGLSQEMDLAFDENAWLSRAK